jgi:FtsP/CotA-like multicopper oxidase with cupredoxin domain
MAFVVALGIAAALLGVSAFSTPAAAANNVPITLFGSRAGGWGLTNTTVTTPGPPLTVHVGDNVTLNLTSLDTLLHRWFIDYNGNNVSNGAEPTSPNFGTAVLWNFTVSNVTGTYHYRSDRTAGPGDDLSTMWGNITILPAETTPPPLLGGENTVLIVVGVIVIIVAVVAFAAFFWRRMGKPGTPPPPPQ